MMPVPGAACVHHAEALGVYQVGDAARMQQLGGTAFMQKRMAQYI